MKGKSSPEGSPGATRKSWTSQRVPSGLLVERSGWCSGAGKGWAQFQGIGCTIWAELGLLGKQLDDTLV
jgi:hypothetical protein